MQIRLPSFERYFVLYLKLRKYFWTFKILLQIRHTDLFFCNIPSAFYCWKLSVLDRFFIT